MVWFYEFNYCKHASDFSICLRYIVSISFRSHFTMSVLWKCACVCVILFVGINFNYGYFKYFFYLYSFYTKLDMNVCTKCARNLMIYFFLVSIIKMHKHSFLFFYFQFFLLFIDSWFLFSLHLDISFEISKGIEREFGANWIIHVKIMIRKVQVFFFCCCLFVYDDNNEIGRRHKNWWKKKFNLFFFRVKNYKEHNRHLYNYVFICMQCMSACMGV